MDVCPCIMFQYNSGMPGEILTKLSIHTTDKRTVCVRPQHP